MPSGLVDAKRGQCKLANHSLDSQTHAAFGPSALRHKHRVSFLLCSSISIRQHRKKITSLVKSPHSSSNVCVCVFDGFISRRQCSKKEPPTITGSVSPAPSKPPLKLFWLGCSPPPQLCRLCPHRKPPPTSPIPILWPMPLPSSSTSLPPLPFPFQVFGQRLLRNPRQQSFDALWTFSNGPCMNGSASKDWN